MRPTYDYIAVTSVRPRYSSAAGVWQRSRQ
ncbi:unnamed protein product [Nippostrongylus brasiliensis]|uniref:Glycosyl transferase n=1 Tax=Nippostrongylus brasiliensis TaxID=27835 RepID=A0A0N4YKU3_NIPBR|nr:unnamed protein product [Nippostrongylus brasiliensis]